MEVCFGQEVSSAVGQSDGCVMEAPGEDTVGIREEQRKEGVGFVEHIDPRGGGLQSCGHHPWSVSMTWGWQVLFV